MQLNTGILLTPSPKILDVFDRFFGRKNVRLGVNGNTGRWEGHDSQILGWGLWGLQTDLGKYYSLFCTENMFLGFFSRNLKKEKEKEIEIKRKVGQGCSCKWSKK